MPELPEVETIRRQLESRVKGQKIVDVHILFGRKIFPSPQALTAAAKGAAITDVGRRAKLLLLQLSSGKTLVIHLKMSGRILFYEAERKPAKHTFVVFKLFDGQQIFWEDWRGFGFLKVISTDKLKELWKKEGYGPEPLEESFTPEVLKTCLLKHRSKKIKPLLMDQTCVAGIGNIYAAEVLWHASVSPIRAAGKLSEKEIKKLWGGIKKILPQAIRSRGASADAYVDFFGKEGEFVPKLRVYGREGEKCPRDDGGVIKKIVLGGRGTYFCPKCQK